jgi:hypothetical protein
MALYTIFAWTAIVIAGGAYYWLYIRQAPFPSQFLGVSSRPHSRESTAEGVSTQKRKRKSGAPKRRPITSQTNELLTGTSGISGDESDIEGRQTKSRQQVQDERAGLAENKTLKGTH